MAKQTTAEVIEQELTALETQEVAAIVEQANATLAILATLETQAVSTEVATSTMDFRGFEELDMETLTMPTAKLLQQMSPELTDESFADYNFKSGMIIHSLLLEQLQEEFIPLKMHEDKVCFIPRQDADKQNLKVRVAEIHGIDLDEEAMKSLFLCRAKDGKTGDRFGACSSCKLCEFNGNQKPFCNKNVNVLSLFKGQEMPVVIRFCNTSYKHGQQFKAVAFAAGTALFKRVYKLLSTKKTDKGNTWYEMSARPFGKVVDSELPKAEALYNRFASMNYDVAEEVPQGAAPTVAVVHEF